MRESSVRASALILAAVLVVFAPALLQADGLIYPASGLFSDLTITHWPAFEYLRAGFDVSGAIPLWRASILSGTPFAADPVSGLWYPPNWLSLILPLEWFFKLAFVAHLFLAGWAMRQLARSLGAGEVGATAAGLAYALAPRAMGHAGAGHLTLVEAWAWLPLSAWLARRNSARAAIASGVALGVCGLADLRAAVYATLAVALCAIFARAEESSLAAHRSSRDRVPGDFVKRALRLAALLLAAAIVSAVAWLPALSLAGESSRAGLSPDEAGFSSLPVTYLLGTLLASRGDPESLTYVGLTVLVPALIGLHVAWREQRRVAAWLIMLMVIGAIAALGANTPLYALLYRLPGMSLLRVPGRAWFLVAFAAPLACGLGIGALMRWTAERLVARKWMLASWLTGSFGLLFGAGGAWLAFAGENRAEQAGLSLIGLAIFLPLAIGLALARARGRLSSPRFGAVMLAAIAADLAWAGWGQYRVAPRDEVFADGGATAEYLRSISGDAPYRVYSPSYSLPQHVAQAGGLELADGIDPLQLARTVRFMQRATGVGEWGYSVTLPAFEGLRRDEDLRGWLAGVTPDPALLGLLNVKYVVAHFPIRHSDLNERARIGGAIVYENERAMPRVWIVGRADTVNDQAAALDRLAALDLRAEAVVEGGQTLRVDVAASEVRLVERRPDRIVVSARGPGLLVLSEVFERDWRASIDGAHTPIYPANGVLRGVYLPDGEHRVEFVYDPVVVKTAMVISGVGVVGWLAFWLNGRRQPAA